MRHIRSGESLTSEFNVPSRDVCHARLGVIFPLYLDNRTPLVSRIAGAAVFVCLYVGAIDGQNKLRPSTVLWMSDKAARRTAYEDRTAWHQAALRGKRAVEHVVQVWGEVHRPWYADNSREPLRDETLAGWLQYGAAQRDASMPTTSPSPQWSLAADFAELFAPDLSAEVLQRIETWQETHLGPVGLARGLVARQLAGVRQICRSGGQAALV